MYLQICTKCNMKCAHCGFACTNRGTFMTKNIFEAACKLAAGHDECIFLGGGEPTLHPEFWEFLGIAMKYSASNCEDHRVSLVTNGKKAKDAIALAKLARQGIISAALSQDEYHEPIDEMVVQAFRGKPRDPWSYRPEDHRDFREIRTVSRIIARGRGINISGAVDECICPELFVKPDGRIFHCACDDAPQYGTVLKPRLPKDFEGDCYENITKIVIEEMATLGGDGELAGDLVGIEA